MTIAAWKTDAKTVKDSVRVQVRFKRTGGGGQTCFPVATRRLTGLTRKQVFDPEYMKKTYERLYQELPRCEPYILLMNPRFSEADWVHQFFTKKGKMRHGMPCIRWEAYLRLRGVRIPDRVENMLKFASVKELRDSPRRPVTPRPTQARFHTPVRRTILPTRQGGLR